MLPLSPLHRIITGRAPVRDVWRVLHPDSSVGPANYPAEVARGRPVPTAAFNLSENGATSDGVYNTWRWTKNRQNMLKAGHPCPVDAEAEDVRGKRLDYIFASTGCSVTSSSLSSPSSRHGWVVDSASVAMTQRHPELNVSLSDHFAVSATLKLHTISSTASQDTLKSLHDAQLLSPNDCGDNVPLSLEAYDEILALIRRYSAREVRQRYWRAVRFYSALLIWIACLIAVWFSPRNFVAFILMFLSSLSLTAGVVEGLLALLFFSSEIRSLKEFEWEIRTAKSIASKTQPFKG